MRRFLVALAGVCAILLTAVVATAGAATTLDPRNAANPLGVPGPSDGNLIAGAPLYVDPTSPPALAQAQYALTDPSWSSLLGDIAGQPGAHRFYLWNLAPNIESQVAQYMEKSQLEQPGTTVMLSTYTLVHGACGTTAGESFMPTWQNWIEQLAQGIGNYHAIVFLELDSLVASPCLSPAQLAVRESELRYAITTLEADPHVLVYLDGGAADALPAFQQAQLLKDSGVAEAQGFFLNSTHFDWTTSELAYGEEISRLLGGTHFIINTGENGQGPLKPPHPITQGNEVLCNPVGRGLGPLSVSGGVAQPTGYPNADGFLWFTNPGGSGGQCTGWGSMAGAPPTATYWPAYAVMLAQNWVDHVNGPSVPWTPETSVSPRLLSFGRVALGKYKRLRPQISYVNGVGGLFLGSATLSGPNAKNFRVVTDGCQGRHLDVAQSCHLSVQFKPSVARSSTATLTEAVQPPGAPVTLKLTGRGFKTSLPRRTKHKH